MKRHPHFNSIAAAAIAESGAIHMYSRPHVKKWHSQDGTRGYSDKPPGSATCVHPEFVSGDSHFHSVQDANRGFRSLNSSCQQSFNSVPPPLQYHAAQQFYGPCLGGGSAACQQFPGLGPYAYQNQQSYRQRQWLARPPFVNNQQFKGQDGNLQFRPRASKPPDYRAWDYAKPGPPPNSVRFTVLSYNILADYLALDHWQLYSHIPRYMLDWSWRKRSISFELGLWSADILCFQEVDRFRDIEAELNLRGYSGSWKMRTGNAVDGCATFWRVSRFKLLHEESIEYNKLGLRDNVAQICVLESVNGKTTNNDLSAPSTGLEKSDRVVVCNVHVLFNPKRGDVKLGQIRVLLDRAQAVSELWDNAPIVICGDFNCTPKSPLYNFISERKIDLSELPRDKVSGQASAETTPSLSSYHDFRAHSAYDSTQVYVANPENPEQAVVDETSRSGISESLMTESANQPSYHVSSDGGVENSMGTSHASASLESGCEEIHPEATDAANDNHDNLSSHLSTSCESSADFLLDKKSENFSLGTKDADSCEDINSFLSELHNTVHTPFASDLNSDSHTQKLDSCCDGFLNNTLDSNHEAIIDRGRYSYVSSSWTPMEIQTATGSADCNVMEHPLKLRSAYAEVQDPSGLRDPSGEPLVTSYHRRFLGTVDYIWISEDLQVLKVLAPIPKHVMLQTQGFPTKKWGSDHIALVSELAFTKDEVS